MSKEIAQGFLAGVLTKTAKTLIDTYKDEAIEKLEAKADEYKDELFEWLGVFLKGEFDQKTKELMAAVLLTITNALRSVAMDGVDKITDAIPGDVDDKLLDNVPNDIIDFLENLIRPK